MSYADIAGLPLVAGLYTDFAPLIAYAFVGSSKQIAVGPVAIISLLVYQSIPLCNKLCAENNGINATVPVRFKRKVNTTITETLSLSLARYLSLCLCLSLCLSLYSLSLTHTQVRLCLSSDSLSLPPLSSLPLYVYPVIGIIADEKLTFS
jgi:hypothetical protein